ncbi:UbiX family flavin prenyltransferase [Desulfofalx alkaliphila]|uniref:UbiX family flavin prenyltransferase n=1 Tax=Desulfofalx alkaliphila TaxID=105483 RepID=UPI0004E0E42F|nr:UbiX family flavin prenyltransferase [Desulfofalx alkaliphila]
MTVSKPNRIVVAITGASGVIYGVTLLEQLQRLEVETHLIISQWAARTIELEVGISPHQVAAMADKYYQENDLAAAISSGSFLHRGMVICPCSMKTLASIANGNADNLITRAADVTLKEQRRLILVTRETPLSAIHLENMLKLARLGVTIMPPLVAFYQQPNSLQQSVLHFTGRVMDLLNIPNDLVNRWGQDR